MYGGPQRTADVALRLVPLAVTEYLVPRHVAWSDQVNGEHFPVQVIDQLELRLLVSGSRSLLAHAEQFLKEGGQMVLETR
jgi:hypothetical protein